MKPKILEQTDIHDNTFKLLLCYLIANFFKKNFGCKFCTKVLFEKLFPQLALFVLIYL